MVPLDLVKSVNLKLALEAFSFFQENPEKNKYGEVKKEDLVAFILDVTDQSEIAKALPILQDLYLKKLEEENKPVELPQQPSGTIPVNIKELVIALNKYNNDKKKHKELLDKLLSQFSDSYIEPIAQISVPTLTSSQEKAVEELEQGARTNPIVFKSSIEEAITSKKPQLSNQQIESAAQTFLTALTATPTLFAVQATLSKQPELIIPETIENTKEIREKVKQFYSKQIEKYVAAKLVLVSVFDQTIVEALIPDKSLIPQEIRTTKTPINPDDAIKINPKGIFNIITTSEPQFIADESIENIFVPILSVQEDEEAQEIEDFTSTPSAFWTSPISAPVKSVLWMGAEKLAEDDPAKATALALAGREIKTKDIHNLKIKAMSMGVSLQQWDMLERSLKRIESGKFNWIQIAYATGISGIDENIANSLFSGGQINFQAIAPQHTFLGGTIFSMGKQILGNRIKGFITNRVFKEVGVEAVKKAASSLAGKAATGLLSSLNAVLPGLGQVIAVIGGKIVGWVAGKALPFIAKNIKGILVGGGVLVGFAIGGIGGAVIGGIGTGAIASVASGTGVAGTGSVLASTVGAFAAGLGAAIASAMVAPLIFIALGLPVAIALILFIINSGAYIVPPGATSVGQVNPGVAASGTCPLLGKVLERATSGSYNPATETGHGSNPYWGKGPSCSYNIPLPIMYPGCTGPNIAGSSQNVCSKQAQTCPYYGYASDVFDVPEGQSPGAQVALPFLCEKGATSCPALTWTLIGSLFNCGGSSQIPPAECTTPWGYAAFFTANGNGHTWKINLNHVDYSIPLRNGSTYPSGTIIGNRTGSLTHIHIELDIDETPVKPEFLCGG